MANDCQRTQRVMNPTDGWKRVIELMREEDSTIPTDKDVPKKWAECNSLSSRINSGFFNSLWLPPQEPVYACWAEASEINSMISLTDAIAINALAVVDETDVGSLTQAEIDDAVSYARSRLEYFRNEVIPALKKTPYPATSIYELASEIRTETRTIIRENLLNDLENNPELYLGCD